MKDVDVRIQELRKQGLTLPEIANALKAEGYKTPGGKVPTQMFVSNRLYKRRKPGAVEQVGATIDINKIRHLLRLKESPEMKIRLLELMLGVEDDLGKK